MMDDIAKTMNEIKMDNNQPVLKYVQNDRMGGRVPAWEQPETPKEKVMQELGTAENGLYTSFEDTMASFADSNKDAGQHGKEAFGFGDIIDMVNPLQHVPVVNMVYREITGDDIKPISQIIGGTAFGGFTGAVSGLANIVMREEMGDDIPGLMKKTINQPNAVPRTEHISPDDIAKSLSEIEPGNGFGDSDYQTDENEEHGAAYSDLPGTALAVIDLSDYASDYLSEINNASDIAPKREAISKLDF